MADFFSNLHVIEGEDLTLPGKAEAYRRCFYEMLHESGVEHCNFGIFGVEEGAGRGAEFAGSLMPAAFVEEYTNDLACDDCILLRAQFLDDRRPLDRFDFGIAFADQQRTLSERAPLVQEASARHGGWADGVALIGQARDWALQSSRYFGFAFGGDMSSGRKARERFDELQVAAFALMDRLMPVMRAANEGFGYDLTNRERDMLGELANGLQRGQIAHHYAISVATVDMHLGNVRRKLGAQTLAEAVARGFRYGLL